MPEGHRRVRGKASIGMAEGRRGSTKGRTRRCRPRRQLVHKQGPESPNQAPNSRVDDAENQDLPQAFDIRVRVCYTSPSRGQPWPWAPVTEKEATPMSIETTVRKAERREMPAKFLYLSRCEGGAAMGRLA